MSVFLDLYGVELLTRRRGTSVVEQIDRERLILSCLTNGQPLADVLRDLLVSIEVSAENGLKVSILELSSDGQRLTHLAAPTLPVAFCSAIDGVQVGPCVGSCGTAVHRAAPVYVADIENDPLWADYREVALACNLQACWSTPINGMDGKILGTFAVYYDRPRMPRPRDLEAISAVTLTVALAIERHRADAEILRLKSELKALRASI